MCVDTLVSIVLIYVRTKHCLIFVHVEIFILLDIVQYLYHDLILLMSERTVISILTLVDIMRVVLAKLPLVSLRVIQLLQLVMRIHAVIPVRAHLIPGHVRTHRRCIRIHTRRPSSVLLMMVIVADFHVMIPPFRTLFHFEHVQVKLILFLFITTLIVYHHGISYQILPRFVLRVVLGA